MGDWVLLSKLRFLKPPTVRKSQARTVLDIQTDREMDRVQCVMLVDRVIII